MDWTTIGIAGATFLVGYVLGRTTGGERTPAPPPAPVDAAALEAVRPIYENEGMIAAVKAYRERTGVGLRDAKLAVDKLATHTR